MHGHYFARRWLCLCRETTHRHEEDCKRGMPVFVCRCGEVGYAVPYLGRQTQEELEEEPA